MVSIGSKLLVLQIHTDLYEFLLVCQVALLLQKRENISADHLHGSQRGEDGKIICSGFAMAGPLCRRNFEHSVKILTYIRIMSTSVSVSVSMIMHHEHEKEHRHF
jgi:hypothetical protein